ncbi:hypothetical protein [Cohnella hongkongensis]|uniref:Spore coat protein n=1 Tax=Cohnella hongkongensis TaxID=178337 RepID=A0ABV9FJL5_9BACL
MFKWISWAVRTVVTALLLSFLCIWTTGYIVNSYMESVLKQLQLPLEVQPLALSGVWGTLWGAERPPEKEAAEAMPRASEEALGGNFSPQPTPNGGEDAAGSGTDADGTEEDGATDEPSPPPEPAGGEPLGEEGEVPGDSVPVFGGDSSLGQQLTDSQRQSLYALVVSKLNPEQLRQLSNSLQDGLTADELADMQAMLQSALTEEEYAQMMTLLQGEPAQAE